MELSLDSASYFVILGSLQVSVSCEMSFCLFPKHIEDQSVLNTGMPCAHVITVVTLL